jgi:hypothetical protein
MTIDRKNAIIIGILYILAAVSSIIAVILYQPILSDKWYLVYKNGLEFKVLIGILNDIILVISAIGTAVMLSPYLKRWNERIALGYLCLRFMEAVFIAIGIVGILALLHLSEQYSLNLITNKETLNTIGEAFQSFHRWTAILGPNLMLGLNTTMYSYLLYRTNLVPKILSLFGIITAILVFIAGMLEIFGIVESFSSIKGLIALPVGIYEISLAIFLIIKGFNKSKLNA